MSAIGSAILPKLVTRFHERASCPSSWSVKAAAMKTSVAASLMASPWPSMSQMKTGTRMSLSTVRALAMLSRGA